MIWASAGDFFSMGGYGSYVWSAYGVTLALMLIEPVLAARRRQRALRDAADHDPDVHDNRGDHKHDNDHKDKP